MLANLKVVNGHTVGTPDMLPKVDGRESLTARGMRMLYLTSEGKGHGTPSGMYQDRAGHLWTWNAQVGWVLSNPTGRYARACYVATLARRFGKVR